MRPRPLCAAAVVVLSGCAKSPDIRQRTSRPFSVIHAQCKMKRLEVLTPDVIGIARNNEMYELCVCSASGVESRSPPEHGRRSTLPGAGRAARVFTE